MIKVIFATGNKGKLREIKEILGEGYEVITMKEAGFTGEIKEDGTTFAENAEIKVRTVRDAGYTGEIIMADDSGLVVDALGGEPGVYSARYMGEDTSYEIKNRNIIERVAGASDRSGRFICDMCAALPDGSIIHTEGAMPGEIALDPAGEGGFGYDPILFLPEYGKTSAELSEEEKNAISHRGKALRAMKEKLEKVSGRIF